MELKELPAELVSFVEQALASGTYASAEALVADAVRVLRDEAGRTARPPTPETPVPIDITASTPDEPAHQGGLMPLFFADGSPFVTGSQSHVFYAPTPAEPKARLVLRVALEGLTTQAMVDTGGLYLFCMPSIVRALHLDAAQALGAQTILFRDARAGRPPSPDTYAPL